MLLTDTPKYSYWRHSGASEVCSIPRIVYPRGASAGCFHYVVDEQGQVWVVPDARESLTPHSKSIYFCSEAELLDAGYIPDEVLQAQVEMLERAEV